MNDLDIMMAGGLVTFIAFAGAYIAVRNRANESPVDTYVESRERALALEASQADNRIE